MTKPGFVIIPCLPQDLSDDPPEIAAAIRRIGSHCKNPVCGRAVWMREDHYLAMCKLPPEKIPLIRCFRCVADLFGFDIIAPPRTQGESCS